MAMAIRQARDPGQALLPLAQMAISLAVEVMEAMERRVEAAQPRAAAMPMVSWQSRTLAAAEAATHLSSLAVREVGALF